MATNMHLSSSESLTLGIDLGTTSVKTVLFCNASQCQFAQSNFEHDAELTVEERTDLQHREQDIAKLLNALDNCIEKLPKGARKCVKNIVICGQMHGCVFWNSKSFLTRTKEKPFSLCTNNHISTLVTWEDKRCSDEFLSSLPDSSLHIASGYGCATIFWLHQHMLGYFEQYDCAGTVMDFLVSYLIASDFANISTQNACSWGYYDQENKQWEFEKLIKANFPVHILPTICEPGHIAGKLSHKWHEIHEGVNVFVALGDMQCSILATQAQQMDVVLNIGTSAQLAVVIEDTFKVEIYKEIQSKKALQILPYFSNNSLIVAAALNGGNVLATFVNMLENWMRDLGVEPPSHEKIYDKLLACAITSQKDLSQLKVDPILWGERHATNKRASVVDITMESLSLGNVYKSVCSGVLYNVRGMFGDFFEKHEVRSILGTGNALLKNNVLCAKLQEIFCNKPVKFVDTNAAIGAAMSAVLCCGETLMT